MISSFIQNQIHTLTNFDPVLHAFSAHPFSSTAITIFMLIPFSLLFIAWMISGCLIVFGPIFYGGAESNANRNPNPGMIKMALIMLLACLLLTIANILYYKFYLYVLL
jgi:hypothetical protein